MLKNKSALGFALIVGLPLCAGHPGDKTGKYMAKDSRKSMRIGPDRAQQRKQDAWEMIMAKKAHAQKAYEQQEQKAVVPTLTRTFTFPIPTKSAEKMTEQEYTSKSKPLHRHTFVTKNHNLALMAFITLLCIPPCAAFCDSFDVPVTGGDAWRVCQQMTQYINHNRGTFEEIHQQGRKIHEFDGRGVIDFPPTIEMACPPDLNFHWRIDHSWDWYHKGRAFLDASCAKYKELNQRIEEHNKKIQPQIDEQNRRIAEHHKKVERYERLMKIETYMGGQYHHLNPDCQRSFDSFLKDPDKYLSRPDAEFDADPLVLLGAIAEDYASKVASSQVNVQLDSEEPGDRDIVQMHSNVGTKKGFLKLMRSHDEYVNLVKELIKILLTYFKKFDFKNGKDGFGFDVYFGSGLSESEVANLKKHIVWVSETIKGPVTAEYLASELEWLLNIAKKDGYGFTHLKARLNELSHGLLYAGSAVGYDLEAIKPLVIDLIRTKKPRPLGVLFDMPCEHQQKISPPFIPGSRILCSPQGICGISDAVAAALGGAKTDFMYQEIRLKDMLVRVDSAQDLRRF